MLKHLLVGFLALTFIVGFGQDTRHTYSCGWGYQPFDLAFGGDGTLYSTSEVLGAMRVFRHHRFGCIPVGKTDGFLAVSQDGNICITQSFNLISLVTSFPPPIYFEWNYDCRYGRQWQTNYSERPSATFQRPTMPRGFASLGSRLWLSVVTFKSESHPLTERLYYPGYFSSVLLIDGGISTIATLEDLVIHFLTLAPNGEIFVSALQVDTPVNGFPWRGTWNDKYLLLAPEIDLTRGSFIPREVLTGSLLKITQDGQVTTMLEGLSYPSGILVQDDKLWLADYKDGTLSELTLDGTVLARYGGFRSPMGIEQAPNGDICVAEMAGGRITCLSVQALRETSVQE